jgi:hypothetical protein
MLRRLHATRMHCPCGKAALCLPSIVEADDLKLYVVKFCGAGQGKPILANSGPYPSA